MSLTCDPAFVVSTGQVPLAGEDRLHRRLQRLPRVSDHGYRDPLHLQVGGVAPPERRQTSGKSGKFPMTYHKNPALARYISGLRDRRMRKRQTVGAAGPPPRAPE